MMSEQDVRRKILDLLSDGKIDADQATELLRTVGGVGASQGAQVRIVDMLGEEQVSFEQTLDLLKSLASSGRRGAAAVVVPPIPPVPALPVVHTHRSSRRKGIAKVLRIHIDAGGEDGSERAKVRVNVPIALAKFAGKFLPSEAKEQLAAQGIDITEILDALGDELPDGPLVDIDAVEGDGKTRAKIIIEVA
jgi:hypothetical protein